MGNKFGSILLTLLLLYKMVLGSNSKSALLIIDVQNCFLPGGSLAVTDGEKVIPVINDIRSLFDIVVLTQDWHCSDHVSFASQHSGKDPFDEIVLEYDESGNLCEKCAPDEVKYKLNQTLWPDHCIIDTDGAKIRETVLIQDSDIFVKKGYHCDVDSYSAFYDNGGFSKTELDSKLKELEVGSVFVSGLALDFCVKFTALDAKNLNYKTYVLQDASRGISDEGITEALEEMKENGIEIIDSEDLEDILNKNGQDINVASKYVLTVVLLFCSLV